jgi:hypothetical protein
MRTPASLPLIAATRDEQTPVVRNRPALSVLTLASIEMLVSPFPSFRDVGRFHQTLAALPSVRAVQLRRLQHGTMQVRVECRSAAALIDELAEACERPFRIIAQEPHCIEIALDAEHDCFDQVEDLWA